MKQVLILACVMLAVATAAAQDNCAYCDSCDNGICRICKQGWVSCNNGGCCPANGAFIGCNNCDSCNNDICTTCKTGYIPCAGGCCPYNSGFTGCTNCDSCDNNICVKCKLGYGPCNGGCCATGFIGCNNCDSCNNNICERCKTGFTPCAGGCCGSTSGPGTNTTTGCTNCDSCNNNVCLTCKTGFTPCAGGCCASSTGVPTTNLTMAPGEIRVVRVLASTSPLTIWNATAVPRRAARVALVQFNRSMRITVLNTIGFRVDVVLSNSRARIYNVNVEDDD